MGGKDLRSGKSTIIYLQYTASGLIINDVTFLLLVIRKRATSKLSMLMNIMLMLRNGRVGACFGRGVRLRGFRTHHVNKRLNFYTFNCTV